MAMPHGEKRISTDGCKIRDKVKLVKIYSPERIVTEASDPASIGVKRFDTNDHLYHGTCPAEVQELVILHGYTTQISHGTARERSLLIAVDRDEARARQPRRFARSA